MATRKATRALRLSLLSRESVSIHPHTLVRVAPQYCPICVANKLARTRAGASDPGLCASVANANFSLSKVCNCSSAVKLAMTSYRSN